MIATVQTDDRDNWPNCLPSYTPSSNPSYSPSGNSGQLIVFHKVSWILWIILDIILYIFFANVCKVLTYRQYVIICHAKDVSKMGKNSRSECTWTAAISLCLVEEGVVARRRRSAGVDGFEQERLPFIRPESCYSRRHEWFGHRLIDRDSRTRFAAFLATCRQSLGPA